MNYIALRLPEMMPRYRKIQETVHAMISQAFSNAVITPGETTTEDVVWWLRQKSQELGYTNWFQPSVDVQRRGGVSGDGPTIIQPGDLLWTDFGVVAMNLHTDTQHLGYVLRPGETEAPEGLKQCLADSNRMQDLLLEEMEPGPHRQRDPGGHPGAHAGRGDRRDGLHPSHRRPRPRRGSAHRPLGRAGRRAGPG
jgi:hypothetical protein